MSALPGGNNPAGGVEVTQINDHAHGGMGADGRWFIPTPISGIHQIAAAVDGKGAAIDDTFD